MMSDILKIEKNCKQLYSFTTMGKPNFYVLNKEISGEKSYLEYVSPMISQQSHSIGNTNAIAQYCTSLW